MSYELLVLDIDGTLVNTKKEITDAVRNACINCQKRGKKIAIATGRCKRGVRNQVSEIQLDRFGGFVVSINGAQIHNAKTNKEYQNITLPSGMIYELYDYACENGCGILTYDEQGNIISLYEDDKYVLMDAKGSDLPVIVKKDFRKEVFFAGNKMILTGEPELLRELEPKATKKYEGVLSVYKSEEFYLEFMPYGVDKAMGIGMLSEKLGIDRENIICCGDGFNDIPMIEYAGLGVAMGNASYEVKKHADFIAPSCDEDGLVTVINQFMMD